jgi:hypothetical protein
MKTVKFVFLLIIAIMFFQSCNEAQQGETLQQPYLTDLIDTTKANDTLITIDTDGYWDNGQIVSQFDCPDSRFFPSIDLKNWDKISVVNGRLPTYKETVNGTSIHTYGGTENKNVRPYKMTLPRLAYFVNGPGKIVPDSSAHKMAIKPQLVVVIQVVQTLTDTLVGFRYLTGGVGGSYFRDFHFLNYEEANKLATEPK